MPFCLPKFEADTFIEKLKAGEINPETLTQMTSSERRDYFEGFMAKESAKQTNSLFESKLLLKNQQQGIINWAKTLTGIKPEVKRDILAKVNKMTEILKPGDEELFLSDLAEKRLGIGVTPEEAGTIADMAKTVSDAQALQDKDGYFPSEEDRMAYGRAKIKFSNYVSGLKNEAEALTIQDAKTNPGDTAAKLVSKGAGLAKSLKASLDDSAIFRQGWKTLFTNPQLWQKNAFNTFKDAWNTFGGKDTVDEVMADIVSRPMYKNMQTAKLALGNLEEAYPTSFPEKIPYIGRAYKASEAAYTGFVYRMRADIFDKYMQVAAKSGLDITDKAFLESVGKLVNSLTGRGHLGKIEPIADVVNNVFFSPRFLKSQIDFLTAHQFQKDVDPFVRKTAAVNLVKVISGIAAILGIAYAINPKSVEWDSRSSDFGKIKVGNTRFDVSGGMSSVIVLAARILSQESKSSTSGNITQIDSGQFGAPSTLDTITNFFANKVSPFTSFLYQMKTGNDFGGKPVSKLAAINNLLTPLPITNYFELKNDPNSANVLLSVLFDAFGISTNSYATNSDSQKGYNAALAAKEGVTSENRARVQAIYDQNQALKSQGKTDAANAAFDDLSVEDKKIYNNIKKTADQIPPELKAQMFDEYGKNQDLIDAGKKDEAEANYASLTDDEKKAYDSVKKQFGGKNPGSTKSSDKRTLEPGTYEKQSFVTHLLNGAKALGTDPVTFFKREFSGDKIVHVENGTVYVERMSFDESQKARKDAGKDTQDWKLDHAVPLEIGGGNEKDNWNFASTEQWKLNTPVENFLAKAVDSGKIDHKKAAELMIRYKMGLDEELSPSLQKKYTEDYGGTPITKEEIYQSVK